jgi:hypothetical protein
MSIIIDDIGSIDLKSLNIKKNNISIESGIVKNHLQTDWNYDLMNIYNAWSLGISGKGINIAILDDGIDINTKGLFVNLDKTKSDLIKTTLRSINPTSNYDYKHKRFGIDTHGTMVSGIALGNTSTNFRGVGYNANLIAVNILGYQTLIPNGDFLDLELEIFNINGINIDIVNKSYGVGGFGLSLFDFDVNKLRLINDKIKTFRNGKGGIVVNAAGNEGLILESKYNGQQFISANYYTTQLSNLIGTQNWSTVISVSAVNKSGLWSLYSNMGCNILCSGPAGGDYIGNEIASNEEAIRTTYILNRMTNRMNGTSASAPHISGLCGLILEANSELTSRQVKEIISRCSTIPVLDIDGLYGDQTIILSTYKKSIIKVKQTNDKNRMYSLLYGYGVPDAYECVKLAKEINVKNIIEYEDLDFINMNLNNQVVGIDVYNNIPLANDSSQIQLNAIQTTLKNLTSNNKLEYKYQFNHLDRITMTNDILTDNDITLEMIKLSFNIIIPNSIVYNYFKIIHDLEMVLVSPDNTEISIIKYYQYNSIVNRYVDDIAKSIDYGNIGYESDINNQKCVILIEGLRGLKNVTGEWKLLMTDRYDEKTNDTSDIKQIGNVSIKFYYSKGYPEYKNLYEDIENYYL